MADIFEAETADTFEIGAKASIGELNLNAAAYHTDSENSYFFVFLAANSTQNLGNIPEVRLRGFELDANMEVVDGLNLYGAFGFTDSSIRSFPDPTVIGNEAPLISRYTLNFGAQYDAPIAANVDGLLRLDYRRTGRTWWEPYNTTSRDPVDLVDLRAGVEMGGFNITGFAENLFNEEYNAEFSPGGFVFKARPRRYGVEVGYRF